MSSLLLFYDKVRPQVHGSCEHVGVECVGVVYVVLSISLVLAPCGMVHK